MSTARMVLLALAALASSGSLARADTVVLEDGATYDGRVTIVDEGVRVELDFGTVTFERSLVKRIIRSRSRLDVFDDRLEAAAGDVDALLRLARWSEQHGLERRARDVYRRIVRLEPDHEVARHALGHVRVDGRWLTEDEAKRAAGFVQYGGVWLSPEQVASREKAQARLRAELAAERRAAEPAATARPETVERRRDIDAVDLSVGFGWGWPLGGVRPPLLGPRPRPRPRPPQMKPSPPAPAPPAPAPRVQRGSAPPSRRP
jgi:hypothetical protein